MLVAVDSPPALNNFFAMMMQIVNLQLIDTDKYFDKYLVLD